MKRISLYRKRIAGFVVLSVVTMSLFAACTKVEDAPTELSDTPIRMSVDGWRPTIIAGATIFENEDDFLNDAPTGKGGGNFTLHAYLKENGATYIDGTRAWYFVPDGSTVGSWRFYDEPNIIEYYWPQNSNVDFFTYMPYKNSGRLKSVSIGSYDKDHGLTINCDVHQPADYEDSDGQETIIAYTANKGKEDGKVNMHFVHPFTAIRFKLKQAHRNLKINFIEFDNIYTTGTTLLNATTHAETIITWTQTGAEGTYRIPVDKSIPDDGINFGGEVGCTYLVMPQSLDKGTTYDTADDVQIRINYTWDDGLDTDPTNDTREYTASIATGTVKEWMSGQKYTYVLDLGDNKEEILFKVLVEPWIATGDKNIIDVE